MAYDERLAERLRDVFASTKGVDEKKMFGGIAFMVRGHMCCGVVGDDLMVRVGPKDHEAALARPHARPMDFTGRPSKGMVYVGREGVRTRKQLEGWVQRGLAFVSELPAKKARR